MVSSIEILTRRRRIFRYWAQGLTVPQMQIALRAAGIDRGTSLVTIRRDVRTMEKWLPTVIRAEADKEDVEQTVLDLRARMKLAQERLTQIMYTGDNSAAQVGAANAMLKAIEKEMDLLTRTGQMEPTALKIQQEVTGDVGFTFPELFAEFGESILGDALRRRLQGDRGDLKEDLPESLDTEEKP